MADFNKAFNISKFNAGGYALDPHDIGGETYRDIARKFNPSWEGWAKIDAIKKQQGPIPTNFTSAELDALAGKFYKRKFWDEIMGDKIKDQDVANIIFDQTLDGLGRAIQMTQLALNKKFNGKFPLSNNMSSNVIKKLNSVNPKKFFDEYKEYRIARFQYAGGQLPKTHPLYLFFQKFDKRSDAERELYGAKYINGWLSRVGRFAYGNIQTIQKNPVATIAGILALASAIGAVAYFFAYRDEITA